MLFFLAKYFNFCIFLILFYENIQAFSESRSYTGYKIYNIYAENAKQKEIINKLSKNVMFNFYYLDDKFEKLSVVLVPTQHQFTFEHILQETHIVYKMLKDMPKNNMEVNIKARKDLIDFRKYLTLDEIYKYLDKLAEMYPQHVVIDTIGKSYENRDIKMIKITNNTDWKYSQKKKILIDAGIHAREWMSSASALYIINQLVENYKENFLLLEAYDWFIIPNINPDGYVYTHTHNRLWRKTRQRYNDTYCIGADINRNFPYKWNLIGKDNVPCSITYNGPHPFSESESRALRDVMLSIKGKTILYISLHAFGRFILYPWGWTIESPNNRKMEDFIALHAARRMRRFFNKSYLIGSPSELLYRVSGGSLDYAFGTMHIPHAFVIEVPGDNFESPPTKMLDYVKEAWFCVQSIVQGTEKADETSKNIGTKFNVNICTQILYKFIYVFYFDHLI